MRVERAADPSGPWEVAATLSYNTTSYVDNYRPIEQLVCYRVIATNAYGESGPSNADCTAPPQTPSNSAASANGQSIDVTWTDASTVEDGYEIQHALDDFVWSVIADLPAGASSYQHAAVTPDVRHWYRVRAKKDGGFSDFSSPVWAAVASRAPDAPTMNGASPAGSSWAFVNWNSASITATTFRIQRSTDGQASWVTAGSQSVGDGMYFYDTDRTPESEVCYRVSASNSFGESTPSAVDCTIPPARPTNLAVTDNFDGTITVTWTDNSSVEEAYAIWTVYCDYWDCYWNEYRLDPNVTSVVLSSYEYLDAVYAYRDGGYSDAASWAGTEGLAIVSAGPVARPTKGAKAPRPSAAARALRVSDRLMSARTPPKR